MPYLLNNNGNANLQHPEFGTIPPKTAIRITDRQASLYKTLSNAIVFDDIIDIEEPSKEVVIEPIEIKRNISEMLESKNGDLFDAVEEMNGDRK